MEEKEEEEKREGEGKRIERGTKTSWCMYSVYNDITQS